MLVKVETRSTMEIRGHRGSTEEELEREYACVRGYKQGDTQARKARRKEIGSSRKSGTLIVCTNTRALDRHVDSVLNDIVRKTFGRERKNAEWKLVIRNALNS